MDKKLDKLFTYLKEGAESGRSAIVKKEEVDEYFVEG